VERMPDGALGVDEANIIAALEWAHEHAQQATEVAICDRMRHYWHDRRQLAAGLHYLPWGVAAAATQASATGNIADRQRAADMALSTGELLRSAGRSGEAEEVFRQNLAIRQGLSDQRGAGLALLALGELALERGALAEADATFQQALATLRVAGESRDVSAC